MAKVEITLKKSLSGQKENIRESAKSLGLKKIGQKTVREDTAVVRGQIQTIKHLVEVEEAK
ncbi:MULTISPECIES: 50S ribosomal protein L30 [unclassified Schaalia]|jgi:large subunit ribosomal protein L30|uniref:50S ribosomal protein L30 n=1 Tax=unclassified Schaalia TaxID=2691889 RepID=UPI0015F6AC6C|nr:MULTISPECIES: 50S ribosomal protein L30 [unclassified Schaalia]